MRTSPTNDIESRNGLGSLVSVIQSGLFVIIGLSALSMGVDRFVVGGLAALSQARPSLFLVFCLAFILVAVLGFAITPAEKQLIERHAPGLADFGSTMAVFGHAGTIAFFSWWALHRLDVGTADPDLSNRVAPVQLGVMFELVFVGGWVWILAWVFGRHEILPRGFLWLSIFKATCFWFTFLAFFVDSTWMLVIGLGATTIVAGPAWHLWIARLLPRENHLPEVRHE